MPRGRKPGVRQYGLHHPYVPDGPLAPVNDRMALKLALSEKLRERVERVARIDREIARRPPILDASPTVDA